MARGRFTGDQSARDQDAPGGVSWAAAVRHRLGSRVSRVLAAPEAGLATAEYAVATVAAVGFAGLLILVLKSTEVRGMLTEIIRSALSVG